jgi:polyhydroxybutyrate depolymerase
MEKLCSLGAVVAFPRGARPLRSGFEWDLEADVDYLQALVTWLLAHYPGTDGRVCIAGMSGGARMASRFASLHPESVRALGAVAGLRAPAAPRVGQALSVVAFHGTADRINPYLGSGTERWNESVPDAVRAWVKALALPDEPTQHELTSHLTRTDFGEPGKGASVTLYVAKGAGHTWPGSRLALVSSSPLAPLLLRLILGKTSKEVNATDEIWRAMTAPA